MDDFETRTLLNVIAEDALTELGRRDPEQVAVYVAKALACRLEIDGTSSNLIQHAQALRDHIHIEARETGRNPVVIAPAIIDRAVALVRERYPAPSAI